MSGKTKPPVEKKKPVMDLRNLNGAAGNATTNGAVPIDREKADLAIAELRNKLQAEFDKALGELTKKYRAELVFDGLVYQNGLLIPQVRFMVK